MGALEIDEGNCIAVLDGRQEIESLFGFWNRGGGSNRVGVREDKAGSSRCSE